MGINPPLTPPRRGTRVYTSSFLSRGTRTSPSWEGVGGWVSPANIFPPAFCLLSPAFYLQSISISFKLRKVVKLKQNILYEN